MCASCSVLVWAPYRASCRSRRLLGRRIHTHATAQWCHLPRASSSRSASARASICLLRSRQGDAAHRVDPDETILSLAKRQSGAVPFAMECLQAGAESMPARRWFRDTAVVAYALCTIPGRRRRWQRFTES